MAPMVDPARNLEVETPMRNFEVEDPITRNFAVKPLPDAEKAIKTVATLVILREVVPKMQSPAADPQKMP